MSSPCPRLVLRPCLLPQALHNQMLTAVQEISNLIEPVAGAARAEASQLGHKVRQTPAAAAGELHSQCPARRLARPCSQLGPDPEEAVGPSCGWGGRKQG